MTDLRYISYTPDHTILFKLKHSHELYTTIRVEINPVGMS